MHKRALDRWRAPADDALVQADLALRALAEPRRLAILRLVRDRPRAAGEIAEHFDVSQQAVSQHLQVLREAGLLEMRKDGRRHLYALRTDGLAALDEFLRDLWPGGLQRLKQAVEQGDG
jgi:DNA-binding transcriptional ArsR family regulator